MAQSAGISNIESTLLERLMPIFPNLDKSTIIDSIKNPSNRSESDAEPCIQNYIDDLLELRTFTEKTARESSCIQKRIVPNTVLLDSDDDELDLLAMSQAENIGKSQEMLSASPGSEQHSATSQCEHSSAKRSFMKNKGVFPSASSSSTVTAASSSALTSSTAESSSFTSDSKESRLPTPQAKRPHELYDTSWSDSESDSLDDPSENSINLSDSDDGLPKLSIKNYNKVSTLSSSPKNSSNNVTAQKRISSNSSASATKSSVLSPAKLFNNGGSPVKSKKAVLTPPRLILRKTIQIPSSPASTRHEMKIPESSGSCSSGTKDSFSKFREGNASSVDDDITGGYSRSDVQVDSVPATATSTMYRSTLLSPAKLKIQKNTVQEDIKGKADQVGIKPAEVEAISEVKNSKTESISQAMGECPAQLHSSCVDTDGKKNVKPTAIDMPSNITQEEKTSQSGFCFRKKLENTVPKDNVDSSKDIARVKIVENDNDLKPGHARNKNLASDDSLKASSKHFLKKSIPLGDKHGSTDKTSPEKVKVKHRELINKGLLTSTSSSTETKNLHLSDTDANLKVPPIKLKRIDIPSASAVLGDVQLISKPDTKTTKGTNSNPYLIDTKDHTRTSTATAGIKPPQNGHLNVHMYGPDLYAVPEIKTGKIPATVGQWPGEDVSMRRNFFLGPHLPVTHTQTSDRQSMIVQGMSTVNPLLRHRAPDIVDLTQPVETVTHQLLGNVNKHVQLHQNNNRNMKEMGGADRALNPTLVNLAPAQLNAPPIPSIPAVIFKEDNVVSTVVDMFPDVCITYVNQLVQRYPLNMLDNDVINNICNHLLETPAYPRAQKSATITLGEANQTTKDEDTTDYYSEYKEMVSLQCKMQTEQMLQSRFSWISVKDIRVVMRLFRGHYAPSHQVFTKVMKQKAKEAEDPGMAVYAGSRVIVTVSVDGTDRSLGVNFLRCRRVVRQPTYILPELQREVDFVERKLTEAATEADHKIAQELNENEYEETGQLIECGCCYDEVPFENMIQCYEGHLFCQQCLQRYAKEAIFGSGKADLLCMTDGCDASYPQTQLSKALPSNILSKYEDRVQEENINLADLPDLVWCPHCDFAALLDPRYPVFECLNTACCKKTCRHCKEDWSDHIGKTCEQVEKKDEVRLRVQFEEKMSEAKIRTCHKCKTKFTKTEGCNRMTCRCGATMCYICRKPDITYKHFCQHVRDPGKGCSSCQACFLWSSGEEDEKRAIAEIKNQANEARQAQGFQDTKLIGAPDDEPVAKKARV